MLDWCDVLFVVSAAIIGGMLKPIYNFVIPSRDELMFCSGVLVVGILLQIIAVLRSIGENYDAQ